MDLALHRLTTDPVDPLWGQITWQTKDNVVVLDELLRASFRVDFDDLAEMLLLSSSQDIVSLNHDRVILTMLCRRLFLTSTVHSHRALLRTVLFTSGGCELLFQIEIIFRSFFSMSRQRAARLILGGNDSCTHDILARRRVGTEAS